MAAATVACRNGHPNPQEQRFCGKCGAELRQPDGQPGTLRAGWYWENVKPSTANWREATLALIVAVGVGILLILIVILIVLLSSAPWESPAYKQCVSEQRQQARSHDLNPDDPELKRAYEQYCHTNYD